MRCVHLCGNSGDHGSFDRHLGTSLDEVDARDVVDEADQRESGNEIVFRQHAAEIVLTKITEVGSSQRGWRNRSVGG